MHTIQGLDKGLGPAPGERGAGPASGSSSPFLVQAAGGRVKGGDAGGRCEGGCEGSEGAGMGLPWGGGRPGVPGRHQAELEWRRSSGSKARAENLPERWPFLPHISPLFPAASSVSSVKLGLLGGPSHPVLLHSGPRGGGFSSIRLSSLPSPTFSMGRLAPRILQGLQGALCLPPLLRPRGTSGEIQAEPPEVSAKDSELGPVFGYSWWQ